MTEMQKLRPLVQWLAWLESATLWHSIVQRIHVSMQRPYTDAELAQLRTFEQMLGNCIAHLSGVYGLDSGWFDDEEFDAAVSQEPC